MSLCASIAVFVFHVPFRGSVAALFAIASAFLLPSLGQGMLISAAAKNQFLASQMALLTSFLPTFLLSGFIFEISSMPKAIQWVCQLVPARWLIPSLQTVFIAGDIWSVFVKDIAMMVLFGAIFFGLAVRQTKKRVA